MKATVWYGENADPYKFKIEGDELIGARALFTMDGTTAVFTQMNVKNFTDNTASADMRDVSLAKEYAKSLPFVQAVCLEEYEDQ